ncbi:long-chain-fatty-acid--CoA ligase [Paenibacillus sp. Marseille-Q4541]|uniref:long-chain-fatty-acid--CoA ligase n=1 Tax=Paenibacillus sp. Marseille-Q4541 TaxID=2831522 RepID=UPI001BAAB045|nr:long-chain-fatty-acid--CoA ligase [Paenibacillus sp. Marseille-Q4541]
MSWNLVRILEKSAASNPDHPAYVFQEKSTSYAELMQQISQCSSGLASHGIAKGDKVVLLLGNSPEFIISYYGILHLGGIVVPVNPTYKPEEIAYILGNSGATAVIAVGALKPMIAVLSEKIPSVRLTVYTNAETGSSSWEALIASGDDNIVSVYNDNNDTAVILYTSGTTGKPKGAMLSHRNLATNAHALHTIFGIQSTDKVVTVLPMFHIYCMTVCVNAPLAVGSTILIMPRFQPAEIMRTIREQQATMFSGVPTMYSFLLQYPDAKREDFTSIRLCSSGGASLPVEVLHKFEEKFQVKISEGYGLSEASPVTAFNPPGGIRKWGSVGVNIPDVINKVIDVDGNELPRGEVGELIVKGPNVMQGYFNMPEATAAALKDGWLYTGDLAQMDEEGYIFIVDRKKDMINVGGYNVYPREVEEVIYQHPGVFEAAVIGVKDDVFGEKVKAFVVRNDQQLTSDGLMEFCKERLVKYKLPAFIEFIEELPKNSSGKTLRRALRESSASSVPSEPGDTP